MLLYAASTVALLSFACCVVLDGIGREGKLAGEVSPGMARSVSAKAALRLREPIPLETHPMDDSPLPRLNQAACRLAADNERVTRFVRSLPDQVDELFTAALEENWAEVRRLGDFLSASSDAYGVREFGEAARQLCDVCDGNHRFEAKRRLLRLIFSIP